MQEHIQIQMDYGFSVKLNFFVCVTRPLAPVHERWKLMLHALGQTPELMLCHDCGHTLITSIFCGSV